MLTIKGRDFVADIINAVAVGILLYTMGWRSVESFQPLFLGLYVVVMIIWTLVKPSVQDWINYYRENRENEQSSKSINFAKDKGRKY